MIMARRTLNFLSGSMAIFLMACNGIFGGIYDTPEPTVPAEGKKYGFIQVDEQAHTGRIYIDASDFTKWHYIDLHGRKITTTAIDGNAPAAWDFAIHRYDAKTNGGKVAETDATDLGSIPKIGSVPKDLFLPDKFSTDRIIVDLSQMMSGIVVYAKDYYNPCLSKWLDVNLSTMPPIYTLSNKVYILGLTDNTYAALRLVNYMSDEAKKGFMTIDYKYPVQQ